MAKTPKVQPGTKRTTIIEEGADPTGSDIPGQDSLPPANEPSSMPSDPMTHDVIQDILAPQPPEEVAMLLSELGEEDHKVVVYRYSKEAKRFARLDSYSHKEFSLDTLGDTYGGGKYRIYIFRPNGQMVNSKVIDIDEAKKPKVDPHQVVAGAQGTQVILPPQQDMGKIMDLMVAQANQSQVMMMTLVTKMAEAMASVSRQPAAPSLVKDMGDILALQKMFESKGSPEAGNVNAVINGLKQGIELAQMANPNGGESGGGGLMDTIVKNLIPAFVGAQPSVTDKIMGAFAPVVRPAAPAMNPHPPVQARPAPVQPTSPAPVPQLAAPIATSAPVEPIANPPKEQGMNFGLSLLVSMYKAPILDMAKSNFDPEKAAEMIILRIPEAYYPVTLDFTNKVDRLDLVKMAIPELFVIDTATGKDYSEWTGKVLDAGKASLTEYFAPETPETPAPVTVDAPTQENK